MTGQKTLGQINLDAWLSARKHRPNLPISDAQTWEAAASAVREQVIEECIYALKNASQLTKEHEADIPGYIFASTRRQHWGQAAEFLRALLPGQLEEERSSDDASQRGRTSPDINQLPEKME